MQLYFLWAHFLLFQFVYWCSHTSFIDNFTYLLVSPSCMCHRFWLHAFFFSFAYFLCWTNPNYCWWKWFFFSFRWLKFYKNFYPVVTKSTSTETILKSLKNILDCFIGFLCKCKDRLGWLISMPLTNITLLAVYQNYCDSCQPFIFFYENATYFTSSKLKLLTIHMKYDISCSQGCGSRCSTDRHNAGASSMSFLACAFCSAPPESPTTTWYGSWCCPWCRFGTTCKLPVQS